MSEMGRYVDWPAAAVDLYRAFGHDALHPSVLGFLHRTRGGSVLATCSGGADSTALVCVLYAISREYRFSLQVAHYNHRWRGEESDADEAFVERLAGALAVPLHRSFRPENQAAFTETTARALRLEFFRATAVAEGCGCIAFGHHLDDILETQLLRLARGSGSEGMAAPRPVAFFRWASYPSASFAQFAFRRDTVGYAWYESSLARRYVERGCRDRAECVAS